MVDVLFYILLCAGSLCHGPPLSILDRSAPFSQALERPLQADICFPGCFEQFGGHKSCQPVRPATGMAQERAQPTDPPVVSEPPQGGQTCTLRNELDQQKQPAQPPEAQQAGPPRGSAAGGAGGADAGAGESSAATGSDPPASKRMRLDLPSSTSQQNQPAPHLVAFPAASSVLRADPSLVGAAVTGTVDAASDAAYFVSLSLGGQDFKGKPNKRVRTGGHVPWSAQNSTCWASPNLRPGWHLSSRTVLPLRCWGEAGVETLENSNSSSSCLAQMPWLPP